jgi:hypothetical protein
MRGTTNNNETLKKLKEIKNKSKKDKRRKRNIPDLDLKRAAGKLYYRTRLCCELASGGRSSWKDGKLEEKNLAPSRQREQEKEGPRFLCACRASPPGGTGLSRPSRRRDRRAPPVLHASRGQPSTPRWRHLSRHMHGRDCVVWSRHSLWRDQREHGVQIFLIQDYF